MNFDEFGLFGEDAFFSKDCIFLPNFSEQNVAREREKKTGLICEKTFKFGNFFRFRKDVQS